jgi:ATP/maltotriose-dependent transcriptional regulator MalT
MPLSEMVIKSKLIPPHPHKAVFHRNRLQNKLKDSLNYPLTVVYAGTGYGKTTALIELSDPYKQVFWYNITEPDRDPALLFAHTSTTIRSISVTPAGTGLAVKIRGMIAERQQVHQLRLSDSLPNWVKTTRLH